MKIILFIRSMTFGGSQRQLINLAAGLKRRGHDVAIIVLYGGEPMEAQLAGFGVRLIALDKRCRWDIAGPLMRLRQILQSERADVVYAFQPTQTVIASLFLPQGAGRLVFGIRSADIDASHYDFLSRLTYRLENIFARSAALIVSNSFAGRTDALARGMTAERIAVVPNGIDTRVLKPNPYAGRTLRRRWHIADGDFLIGMVARFDPMKDHATFLTAAAEFSRSHADARFVCVGDGPQKYRSEIQQLSQRLGLNGRIVWAGEIADTVAVNSAFDIATLSSAFGEGFPNSLGEAMACERPVVGTNVGDIAVIIDRYGEVVPPRCADQLCAAWASLRQRMAHEPNLGAEARASVEARFGLEKMIEKTEQLFLKLQNN